MSVEPIRVLFVDDHPIVRAGFASLIQKARDIASVGEVATGEAAVELFPRLKPDVTIIDLKLTGMDAIATTRAIRSRFPEARILILTVYEGDENIRRALDAGVDGYLLKESIREELIYAIRTVHKGGRHFSPKIQQILSENAPAVLTERELEVLGWIAKGKDNKGIGKELEISAETVRVHAKRILSKLAASNRTQAVANAIRKGVLRPK